MNDDTPFVFVHGLFGSFIDQETSSRWLRPAASSAPDLHGYGTARGETVTVQGQVGSLRAHAHHGRAVHLVAHIGGHRT